MKIGFIGLGNMAGTICQGLIGDGGQTKCRRKCYFKNKISH